MLQRGESSSEFGEHEHQPVAMAVGQRERRGWHRARLRALLAEYRDGHNPFPERLAVNVLWIVYVHDLLVMTLAWIRLARREIETWDPATSGDPAAAQRLVETMLDATDTLVTMPAALRPRRTGVTAG